MYLFSRILSPLKDDFNDLKVYSLDKYGGLMKDIIDIYIMRVIRACCPITLILVVISYLGGSIAPENIAELLALTFCGGFALLWGLANLMGVFYMVLSRITNI